MNHDISFMVFFIIRYFVTICQRIHKMTMIFYLSFNRQKSIISAKKDILLHFSQ